MLVLLTFTRAPATCLRVFCTCLWFHTGRDDALIYAGRLRRAPRRFALPPLRFLYLYPARLPTPPVALSTFSPVTSRALCLHHFFGSVAGQTRRRTAGRQTAGTGYCRYHTKRLLCPTPALALLPSCTTPAPAAAHCRAQACLARRVLPGPYGRGVVAVLNCLCSTFVTPRGAPRHIMLLPRPVAARLSTPSALFAGPCLYSYHSCATDCILWVGGQRYARCACCRTHAHVAPTLGDAFVAVAAWCVLLCAVIPVAVLRPFLYRLHCPTALFEYIPLPATCYLYTSYSPFPQPARMPWDYLLATQRCLHNPFIPVLLYSADSAEQRYLRLCLYFCSSCCMLPRIYYWVLPPCERPTRSRWGSALLSVDADFRMYAWVAVPGRTVTLFKACY